MAPPSSCALQSATAHSRNYSMYPRRIRELETLRIQQRQFLTNQPSSHHHDRGYDEKRMKYTYRSLAPLLSAQHTGLAPSPFPRFLVGAIRRSKTSSGRCSQSPILLSPAPINHQSQFTFSNIPNRTKPYLQPRKKSHDKDTPGVHVVYPAADDPDHVPPIPVSAPSFWNPTLQRKSPRNSSGLSKHRPI